MGMLRGEERGGGEGQGDVEGDIGRAGRGRRDWRSEIGETNTERQGEGGEGEKGNERGEEQEGERRSDRRGVHLAPPNPVRLQRSTSPRRLCSDLERPFPSTPPSGAPESPCESQKNYY